MFGRLSTRAGVDRAVAVVALASVVALAQFHLQKIVASSIQYDDALNANVAKNLAMGFGYSTSYHEVVPFDLEASTGPVILLPTAALVRLVGNRYWVPTFSIVMWIWATMFLTLLLLRAYLTRTEWFATAGLIALGLMLYHSDEFGLLGDVPCAFLASASVLLVCRPQPNARRMLAAGILLGLAIETKMYAVLVLPAALAGVLASSTGRLRDSVALIAGALVPIAVWEGYRLAGTGFSLDAWTALNAREYAFVDVESGFAALRQSTNVGHTVAGQIADHVASLLENFNGWWSLAVFPAALAVGLGTVIAARNDGRLAPLSLLALVLSAAATIHLAWWLVVESQSWYRHLLPAIVYLLLVAAIAGVASFRASARLGSVAIVLLLASWAPNAGNLRVVFRGRFRPEPRLTALLATRDEMVELQADPNRVFVGCGWWVPRDLEYLLPRIGNFKDALRLQPKDVEGKTIVLVRNEFFNWQRSPSESAFQATCDRQTLFRREPFVISVCPSLPSQTR